MRHVISSTQFTKENVTSLFALTSDIKNDPSRYYDSLRGKVVATLFYEPSTRTRLSFESAIQRLGANLISTENAKEVSSAVKGESLTDTIRIVEGYAEAIVMRHHENDAAAEASRVASVPIINAGGGSGEHPTQSLLDSYTIFEQRGSLDRLSVAVIGDLRYGRTVHSLVKILSLFEGLTIYGVSLPSLELSDHYIQYLEDHGGRFIACNSLKDIPGDIDVLYQTRTQRERMTASEGNVKEIIINKQVLSRFHSRTMVLHPLPRNQEISPDIDHDPRALYFEQAKNGMWVRMALLYALLTENR
jgi:aspartate carbamoyltransferase catalytic subunit